MEPLIYFVGTSSHPLNTILNNNNNRSDTTKIKGLDIPSKESPDVTDNIPDRVCGMDPLDREDERQKTFYRWPLDWLDKNELARTGMFYTGVEDKVKCQFCGVVIGLWEPHDHPVLEHLHWSPHCPLLRRRTTSNIPISQSDLDRILPPISYDICGLNDTIEVRPHSYPESSGSSSRTSDGSLEPNDPVYFPTYPDYVVEAARLRSFANWPADKKQTPQQLAEAGFFYIGVSDRVKCFSCGGGLGDWAENDDPWEQHAEWFSHCHYLQLLKGQTFIDSVQKRQEANKNETTTELAAAAPVELTEMPNESIDLKPTECYESSNSTALEAKTTSTASASVEQLQPPTTTEPTNSNDSNCDIKEKKSNPNLREDKLCKICYADEYSTAFAPCGHVVACLKCASSVTICPVCRKSFSKVLHIYFS